MQTWGRRMLRVLGNIVIVAIELAMIAGLGYLAWAQPLWLAGGTLVLALTLGLKLEIDRVNHEMPFYFTRTGWFGRVFRIVAGSGEAVLKAVVAAGIALITFSGTDSLRLQIMAAVFAALVLVGSMAMRRATLSLGMRPARWGYFRMGAPLGVLYAVALSAFPAPNLGTIAWRAIFDLPKRPTLADLGETLFNVRLWVDDMIVQLMVPWLGTEGARIAGLLISSNILTGFLIALYAVIISEIVRALEERLWGVRATPST